jgi:hypothetical protein
VPGSHFFGNRGARFAAARLSQGASQNLFHDRQEHSVTLIGFAFNREHDEETPNMRKIALLALGMSCMSAPAFSQATTVPAPTPNAITPSGTTPTQTAPSIAGGVPNPVSPLGVDPRTQQPVSPSGQPNGPIPQNLPQNFAITEPHLTPLGAATMQQPIGRLHTVVPSSSLPTATQRAPNEAGCGFACGPATE